MGGWRTTPSLGIVASPVRQTTATAGSSRGTAFEGGGAAAGRVRHRPGGPALPTVPPRKARSNLRSVRVPPRKKQPSDTAGASPAAGRRKLPSSATAKGSARPRRAALPDAAGDNGGRRLD